MRAQGLHGTKALAAVLSFSLSAQATLRPLRYIPQPEATSRNLVHSTATPRSTTSTTSTTPECRSLPGDADYPTDTDWSSLNETVGGRLLRATPLAQICYGATIDATQCATLQSEWATVDPFLDDPANFMAPYWLNNTCSPFQTVTGTCQPGNLASHVINVTDASQVVAGLQFAKEHNVRLTIKNTGHDLLGRSSGAGSLALWTHHMKDVSFLDYSSTGYTGPAVRAGAGVQVHELYQAGKEAGYRVVGGGCPTVGAAGGWLPGGGHGPLTSAYGLGADEVLEFEVVTPEGKQLTASATENSDLYWALAGGGAGNYAVVLSITVKAHPDGPVAGTKFLFTNTDADAYWAAVAAWVQHLLVLDADYPALKTAVTFTDQYFYLDFATFPDATVDELNAALDPFYQELEELNIQLSVNDTQVQDSFLEHYEHFSGTAPWTTNQTVGSRLIPRSLVQDNSSALVSTIRGIANRTDGVFVFVAANVTHERVGNQPSSNAVLPAWRDALFLLNFGMEMSPEAGWDTISSHQVEVNSWLDSFRELTPGGGSYLNEGLWDDANWKTDYFGDNYDKLASIKSKYDPDHLLWAVTAVGSDAWTLDNDARLCRAA